MARFRQPADPGGAVDVAPARDGEGGEGAARPRHAFGLAAGARGPVAAAAGPGQRRRPAVLRRGALPLRSPGQGPVQFEVVPHVSSMQLAFGGGSRRAGRTPTWHEGVLAGRPLERRSSTASGRPRRWGSFPATRSPPLGWLGPCSTAGSTTSAPTSASTSARADEQVTQGRTYGSTSFHIEFDPLQHVVIL